jgi:hypothetical protein
MLGFVTQVASIILPVTYTDVHLARTNFFVGLFRNFRVEWSGLNRKKRGWAG